MRSGWTAACVWLALCWPALAAAQQDNHPEARLVRALDELQAGRADAAMQELAGLTRERPNFKLAQLIYGDLLRAQSGAPQALAVDSQHARLQALIEEARFRGQHRKTAPPSDAIPSTVLRLAEKMRVALVDLNGARLYLLEGGKNGRPHIREHYYAGIGVSGFGKTEQGDSKTPVGLYRVTGFLPPAELTEFYGAGALPLSYPNRFDRAQNRSGGGIWIHGVPPNTYTRAPRSSRGCVTVSNEDLEALRVELASDTGAPVLLSDQVQWLDAKAARKLEAALLQAIEQWRKDWESRKTVKYLSHYARDFRTDDQSLAEFTAHKKRVNAAKTRIRVKLTDLSVFAYPQKQPLYLASFRQEYSSNDHKAVMQKQQYWRRSKKNRWEIIYEGTAALD
ncbi:MAG: L,D-transpeptidase family protein [Arenimonas sp.]